MIDEYRICPNVDDCLLDLPLDNRLAVATPRNTAMNNINIPNWKIYCFSNTEHIYDYPLSLFMQHEHPLLSRINRIVQMSMEGGLFTKWNLDCRNNINRSYNYYHANGSITLTLEHIFTGLVLYAVFVSFAIGAFIAEHIVHPIARRRNCARIWKWFDMLIDGDRHFLLSWNRNPMLSLRRRH